MLPTRRRLVFALALLPAWLVLGSSEARANFIVTHGKDYRSPGVFGVGLVAGSLLNSHEIDWLGPESGAGRVPESERRENGPPPETSRWLRQWHFDAPSSSSAGTTSGGAANGGFWSGASVAVVAVQDVPRPDMVGWLVPENTPFVPTLLVRGLFHPPRPNC